VEDEAGEESGEIWHRDNVSEERKRDFLREFHDSPLGGHQGVTRTYERMKAHFEWPNMKEDVKKYIKECEACQKNKGSDKKTRMPMEITSTPNTVMEKCALEICGPYPVTLRGNRFLLTFQDELSKYILAFPIEK
jgi:hypothetical protein